MKKNLAKILSVLIIFLLIFGRPTSLVVMAQEIPNEIVPIDTIVETPPKENESVENPATSEHPSEILEDESGNQEAVEPVVNVGSTAEIETTVESEATTGGNVICEVPSEELEIYVSSESAQIVDETGESPTSSLSHTEIPQFEGEPVVETGDAVSETYVENEVNYTEIDSEVSIATLNIFASGDIDMSIDPEVLAQDIFTHSDLEGEVNVQVTKNSNYTVLTNEIFASADTGNNFAVGENAVISTGNSYSLVTVVNRVNTVIVGSEIQIIYINIFAPINGNIILPELVEDEGACCGGQTDINNSAEISNSVISVANTGSNDIYDYETDENSSTIATGDAVSAVNIFNLVNRSYINTDFYYLYINQTGTWVGDFLGWGSLLTGNGQDSLYSSSNSSSGSVCDTCVGNVEIENSAHVQNNIYSNANTGGNTAVGNNSTIMTGNSSSIVNLFNFVNVSIVNSRGYFVFVNILDSLTGNIGGVSEFPKESDENDWDDENTNINSDSEGGYARESGAKVEVYQSNNVNDFVYPGDTVTFFIKAKNIGTGKLYDSKLYIELINENNQLVGGGEFYLGEIKAHQGLSLTTGMVLSKNSPAGKYKAHAYVVGFEGNNNNEVLGYADSFFDIVVKYANTPNLISYIDASDQTPPLQILGTNDVAPRIIGRSFADRNRLLYSILILSWTYVLAKKFYPKRRVIWSGLTAVSSRIW